MKLFKKKQDKKRRKMIAIFAPISIGVVALSLGLGLGIRCNGNKSIPVTNKFYRFANDRSILGWSVEVIDNPQILRKYNTMNLHGKTINGECRFTMNDPLNDTTQTIDVFNQWACHGIDLSDTSWSPYNYDNYLRSKWATGYRTFAYATFPALETINLSGAVFAAANVLGDYITTAFQTFRSATFPSLETLNFSGAVFATSSMTSNGDVLTSDITFKTAQFPSLKTLDLGGVFAATNMASGDVFTAYMTFLDVAFTSLETLNLSGAVFATSNMTTSDNVYTSYITFRGARFTSLETLNFGNCEIQGSSTNDNTINRNCFLSITRNPLWTPTDPLKLKSDGNDTYWNSTEASQLNTWFGSNWTFNI